MTVCIDIWLFIKLFDKVILKDTDFKCTETINYFDIVKANASSSRRWAMLIMFVHNSFIGLALSTVKKPFKSSNKSRA